MLTKALHYAMEDPGSLVESCQRALEWILRTHRGRPIHRTWIDATYTEEEINLMEEEVLPAMATFLQRVSKIDRRLEQWSEAFAEGRRPDGEPMGPLLYQSRFGATVEEFAALVEDAKAAHPQLAVVVLDHFHTMGPSPGYGPNTTAELAARAMQIKALAGRCDLDVIVVAQLNRGAYGSSSGPDVSHLAGTSELERFASAVWLIDRPKPGDGPPPPPGLLEVHHGKFRHGQMAEDDLRKTVIRMDRSHCFLEADEARLAFQGQHLYPGVVIP